MLTLATIGYEGASLADFINTLHRVGIKQLIDIRDVPVSRRPGFSKNILARALEDEGLSYLHLKALGDPKAGREAARAGRFDTFREIYNAHLATPSGQAALRVAVEQAASIPSVLLCYERDCKHCHRTIVAAAMTGLHSFQVRHLGVQRGARIVNLDERRLGQSNGAIAISPSRADDHCKGVASGR